MIMSTRISSKETLAKLMATENIMVEHANIPTAGFDLLNRRLLLPNWKDISDDVYTLLISHEVGHALFTPTDEWAKAVLEAKDPSLKGVVNMVEDVRIEKLIQQKYPGTFRSFKSGYDELEKSNLFGTKDRDINSYGLIDRLNLHFKIGHFGYANVPFSDVEKPWLDKISLCKSFSDVLRVAAELKKYVEEHPESQGDSTPSDENTETGTGQASPCDHTDPSDSADSSSVDSSSVDSSSSDSSVDSSADSSTILGGDSGTPRNRRCVAGQVNNNIRPISETQSHFDTAIQKFNDNSVTETTYVNLPNIQLDRIIIPYKMVHEQIATFYSTYHSHVYSEAQIQVGQFKSNSKMIVNQLANIFEMKKKARLDVKSLISRTGKLDMNRVHTYRYSEDVFKKITVTPHGKSHGLIMFIDMSSSMNENMGGTFDQLLNLVLFCRRVGIPFDVYGFSDNDFARRGLSRHPATPGSIYFDPSFCLRHYFSSSMTGIEFNNALQNIICIMKYYSGHKTVGLPPEERLNTTPLVPAIMVAAPLVNKFRQQYKLDIVNTIFLTDGDDTHGLSYSNLSGDTKYINTDRHRYGSTSTRFYLRSLKSGKQWEIKNTTQDMLNILRETTGVKIIGFHIISKRDIGYSIGRFTKDPLEISKHADTFKNHKFAEITNIPGYDAYYLIPSGSNLSISDGDFHNDPAPGVDWEDQKQAKRAVKSIQRNFTTLMKQRVSSRILLNRFIDHIS